MSEVKNVKARLAESQLHNPLLDVLIPDEKTYSVLFLQRQANILASATSVGNEDAHAARSECLQFFRSAVDQHVDLAVTPEYSCPWSALENAITQEIVPAPGALWVIGCESTTLGELTALAARITPNCIFIHETPNTGTKHFLDPVAFVFQSKRYSGEAVVVVLVQFKTEPMADPGGRLEPDNLICGRLFYRFRNDQEQSVSLLVLLCSDSLALAKPENAEVNGCIGQISPLLLLHLQLNTKPRDTIYTRYRYDLLQQQKQREIFAANWAVGTRIIEPGKVTEVTESMSALFFQSEEIRCDEGRVAANHRFGGYPTFIGSCRAFAYVLNFEPLLFLFRSTKASQISGLAQARSRTGHEMLQLRRFDHGTSSWSSIDPAPDLCDVVFADIDPSYITNGRAEPINTERLVLLSCGKVKPLAETPHKNAWPQIEAMETCRLGPLEAIQRLTYGQDQSAGATSYRNKLIARFRVFEQIRKDQTAYPIRLDDFKVSADLHFDINSPYTNL